MRPRSARKLAKAYQQQQQQQQLDTKAETETSRHNQRIANMTALTNAGAYNKNTKHRNHNTHTER
jgi:hypothetical protein